MFSLRARFWKDESPIPLVAPQASFAKTYCETTPDLPSDFLCSTSHRPCLPPSSLGRVRQLSNLGITSKKGAEVRSQCGAGRGISVLLCGQIPSYSNHLLPTCRPAPGTQAGRKSVWAWEVVMYGEIGGEGICFKSGPENQSARCKCNPPTF